ncbi:MAG: HNH endonuclease signature motif containing protein, partial [Pseudomonadota bacterium]
MKQHFRHSARIIGTQRWKRLRKIVLERDGYRCAVCGCGEPLEVDHIKPVRTHPQLAWDLENLQLLCPRHHAEKTRLECGFDPPH